MCAMAASTPSTTRAAMIASRYSVYQSSSLAGRTRIHLEHGGVAADLAAGVEEVPHHGGEMGRDAGAVDQHRLGGAADPRAPHLGVDRDGARHAHVGVAVDVD